MNEQLLKKSEAQDLTQPLKRHWIIVVTAFFSVVFTVGLFTLFAVPQYEAVGTLIFRKSGDLTSQMFDIPAVLMQKYMIKNQIAVLESRQLAIDVIEELKRSPHADSLIVLGYGSQDKLEKTGKIKFTLKEMIDTYRKSIKVTYSEETDIIELSARSPQPWEAAFLVNTWMLIYKEMDRIQSRGEFTESRSFLEKKLREMETKLADSEYALADYQKQKKVVSLTKETEQLVTQLTNFESLYNQTITELDAIENQIEYLKNQLDENKKRLVDDMVNLTSPVLEGLQREMGVLMAEKAAYQAQLLGAGYRIVNDPKLKQLDNRIKGIKAQIIEESKKMVSGDFVGINPLDRSENLINEILKHKTNQQSLQAKAISLNNIVKQYDNKLSSLPEKNIELTRLQRDLQLHSKLYMMVREKFEETRIRESGQQGTIRIVDRAVTPEHPVSPNKMMNMFLATVFGILLGIGLAFSHDFFEDTVRNIHDLENMDIRVIGKVSNFKNRKNAFTLRRSKKETTVCRAKEIFPHLLTYQNGPLDAEEDYQAVCTSLTYALNQHQLHTVLFTSPGPYEGKSTTIANMAITMARKGGKVLLIDTDLRRPVLDLLFMGAHRKIGLTNKLREQDGWRQAIRETSVKGLDLLPAGPAVKNAPDLLSSKAMRRFLTEIKNEYGIILLDSPPILPVTDATILASLTDGVVFVVSAGKTKNQAIRHSIDLLKGVDGNLLGVVLTGAKDMELYGYRNYYRKPSRGKDV